MTDDFHVQEQQEDSPTKNQLLHYLGSWKLVCELNIAQLEEIWSKNLQLTLSEQGGGQLDLNRVKSILYNVGSWNLVCVLNIAQLEEIWSKHW